MLYGLLTQAFNRWTYLGRPPFAALCMRQPGIALRDLNSVGSLFVRTEVR